MKRIIATTLNALFYLVIIFALFFGFASIVKKTNKLVFHPEEINNLRLHAPWFHPADHVVILFDRTELEKNHTLHQNISENILLYDIINRFISLVLMIAMLFILKNLILSIKDKTFFERKNIKLIRYLSIAVGLWVLCKILMYELIPVFVPEELVQESINFITLEESFWGNITSALDFKMLFVSIILYITSVLFREGYQLKEESDLTI